MIYGNIVLKSDQAKGALVQTMEMIGLMDSRDTLSHLQTAQNGKYPECLAFKTLI